MTLHPWHSLVYCIILCIPLSVTIIAFAYYWIEYLQTFLEWDIDGEIFDFIIIGGGSAGAVLANRLSEVSEYRVLLLEAGGSPPFISGVPALATYFQQSQYDWRHLTVPQNKACGAMKDRRCVWPSGKMLGGSSGINYMLYVRGHPEDYNGWSKLGNPGWDYKSVLPFFLKSEKFDGVNAEGHGDSGYLPVQEARYTTPMEQEYVKMIKDSGYELKDLNTATNQTGFMVPHVTLDNGRRGDTYRSYIQPVEGRSNLWIRKYSRATKIDIKDGKVTGVTFSRYGREKSVKSAREVIVSAGTINSAKLLLLSGIGPAHHLKEHNIEVVSDLPVGENLQDHITTMLGPFVLNDSLSFEPAILLNLKTFQSYLSKGEGPMTATSACDLIGFVNSKNNNNTKNPDIQYHFISSSVTADYYTYIHKTFGLRKKIWDDYFKKFYFMKNRNAVSILPIVVRPKSRGTVRLKSSDSADYAHVDPNYFGNSEDEDTIVDGILQMFQMISNSENLKNLHFKIPKFNFPGCKDEELFSESYWRCYVKQMSLTMYHPVGTCKMANDNTGVVDSDLKVKGVSGLRVVDASIMPNIVSGNTNAAVIMIAEKASDLIKADWPIEETNKQSKKDEL